MRVIEAALGALGGAGLEEEEGADSRPSSAAAQGLDSFPVEWRRIFAARLSQDCGSFPECIRVSPPLFVSPKDL